MNLRESASLRRDFANQKRIRRRRRDSASAPSEILRAAAYPTLRWRRTRDRSRLLPREGCSKRPSGPAPHAAPCGEKSGTYIERGACRARGRDSGLQASLRLEKWTLIAK